MRRNGWGVNTDLKFLMTVFTRDFYESKNKDVLPHNIITRETLLNTMSIDILSKKNPLLAQFTLSSHYHIQNFHAVGEIWNMMGILSGANLLYNEQPTIHSKSVKNSIQILDIDITEDSRIKQFFRATHSNKIGQKAISQSFYGSLDQDRISECISNIKHAYSQDGDLRESRRAMNKILNKKIQKDCTLITDGRFSDRSSGLSLLGTRLQKTVYWL